MWKRIALVATLVAVGSAGFAGYQHWMNTPSGKIYVADTFGDDVGVIDIATGKKIKLLRTGKLPHNFAITRDRSQLFLSESGSQSVSLFDTAKDERVLQRIVGPIPDIPEHRKVGMDRVRKAGACSVCHIQRPMGSFISGITLSPDERELLITEMLTQKLTVVNASDLSTLRQVEVLNPEGTTPSNSVYHPLTRDVYVLSRTRPEGRTTKGHGKGEHGGFEHDARKGASYVTVYDTGLTTVKARIRVPFAVPYGAVFSRDGKELYVTYRSTNKIAVIDCETFKHVRTYAVNEAPIGILLAPDDETLMVANFYETPATVQFLDRKTGTIKHTLKVPSSPTLFVQHPRTKLVYMTASGSNKIVEIDPRVPEVKRTFDAGAFPVDIQLVP